MATLRLKVGSNSWADQFIECFYVNGKPDWSEAESLDTRYDPSVPDYVLHFVTFPWKVMSCFYVCFIVTFAEYTLHNIMHFQNSCHAKEINIYNLLMIYQVCCFA